MTYSCPKNVIFRLEKGKKKKKKVFFTRQTYSYMVITRVTARVSIFLGKQSYMVNIFYMVNISYMVTARVSFGQNSLG